MHVLTSCVWKYFVQYLYDTYDTTQQCTLLYEDIDEKKKLKPEDSNLPKAYYTRYEAYNMIL